MASIKEQILVAINSVLDGMDTIVAAYRSRVDPASVDNMPCAVLTAGNPQISDPQQIGFFYWMLPVKVAILNTAPAEADADMDAIEVELFADLMADRTLSGICIDVTPVGVNYIFDEADQSLCIAEWSFMVQYRTSQTALDS